MENVVIKARHSYTIMESKDHFNVVRYECQTPIKYPNNRIAHIITAKGYNLPKEKGITYILEGTFEKYEKNGKTTYTLNVITTSEVVPTEQDAILAYLVTLDGIGKATADKLYTAFGKTVFKIIEKDPLKLTSIKGINKNKATKIQASFAIRQSAKGLFDFLFPYGIKTTSIMKVHEEFGLNAIEKIKENPYCLLNANGIGFKTADYIAKRTGFPSDNPERIKAGIIEVLIESEKGGDVFNKSTPFPSFMLDGYLREPLFSYLYQDVTFTTGGTYLPRDILYLMVLKLLAILIDENLFDKLLFELHSQKKIFISVDNDKDNDNIEKTKVYRYQLAICEYNEAAKICSLLKNPLPTCEDLLETIKAKERDNSIILSNEQRAAVIQAVTSPISVITGGPGTGKTSIQKIILSVFKKYFPKDEILLAAPTGKAAKRMNEQTGYPALTLHKALGLYADDNGTSIETTDSKKFSQKLIIVDETSMVGSYLFNTLLSHIPNGARLVLIGDVDQLPSIEVGAVLRELIVSNIIPVTKLTKTFRQASGSSIVTNAARIKIGEDKLDYTNDFEFIECENSTAIAEKAADILPSLVNTYGDSEVMCLTAFRHKTESGSNALNERLRQVIHPVNSFSKYFETKGTKIYEGDKVMNLKNTALLTNGDIGIVKNIIKSKDTLIVTCDFDGATIALEDEEVDSLELAYATTVHKSQGSEASCVILTTDIAHKIMLKRNLFYTGVTRAKKKLVILGQTDAMNIAIQTQDCVYRRSQLGYLTNTFINEQTKEESNEPEQLSFL